MSFHQEINSKWGLRLKFNAINGVYGFMINSIMAYGLVLIPNWSFRLSNPTQTQGPLRTENPMPKAHYEP